MKHHCPMCGEQWNEDKCYSCGWSENKQPRYTRHSMFSPDVLANALQDRIVPASGKLIKAKPVRVEGLNTGARVNRKREG